MQRRDDGTIPERGVNWKKINNDKGQCFDFIAKLAYRTQAVRELEDFGTMTIGNKVRSQKIWFAT